jgi:pyridoxine kinase
MTDFTPSMAEYMDHWFELGLRFNGICSGFLGSKEQIELVIRFIEKFKEENTIVIIDPVMGDNGHPYPTYTPEMCQEMKRLVAYANILTPNITEACILTDTPYKESWKTSEIIELAKKLSQMGPEKVVITGIAQKSYIANLCFEKGKEPAMRKMLRVGQQRSGTGDVFTSIIAADAINQVPFSDSVKKAGKFVQKCMEASEKLQIPRTDGVAFEEVLHTLK